MHVGIASRQADGQGGRVVRTLARVTATLKRFGLKTRWCCLMLCVSTVEMKSTRFSWLGVGPGLGSGWELGWRQGDGEGQGQGQGQDQGP